MFLYFDLELLAFSFYFLVFIFYIYIYLCIKYTMYILLVPTSLGFGTKLGSK